MKVSRVALLTSIVIHFELICYNTWIVTAANKKATLIFTIVQSVCYVLYPLCGLVADIYVTTYRMIKGSIILLLVSSLVMLLISILMVTDPTLFTKERLIKSSTGGLACVGINVVALGMYEANSIQFGMDQMLDASSEQLSSFIHWYYWCSSIGPLISFYIIGMVSICVSNCVFTDTHIERQLVAGLGYIFIIHYTIQTALAIFGIVYLVISRKHLYIEKVSRNPLKTIIAVIKYSLKHKQPVNRSAFTYWENSIPSRINLGKQKYGGPFTNEQVEDVKCFFNIILLIVSIFGYPLSGGGYSYTHYAMKRIGCPTQIPLFLLVANPEHIALLVIGFTIPFHKLIIKRLFHHYRPLKMLNRLKIGLFLSLVAEALKPFFSLLIDLKHSSDGFNCNVLNEILQDSPTLLLKCLTAITTTFAPSNSTSSSCQSVCYDAPVHSWLYYLLTIPLLLYGISHLMIFMTMLEFICAQAPYTMKGLLIGVLYSTLSIKYFIMHNFDKHPLVLEPFSWNIYAGAKGLCIFVSIMVLSYVSHGYHYRERNEIVNEQAIIEEQYERELLLTHHSETTSLSSQY